jgi:hypothetical protein
MKTCCICQNEVDFSGKTFTPTNEEKQAIGNQPIHYCSSCLGLMEKPQNKEEGAQLLKGLYEMELRKRGVKAVNARKMSQLFYEKLIGSKLH